MMMMSKIDVIKALVGKERESNLSAEYICLLIQLHVTIVSSWGLKTLVVVLSTTNESTKRVTCRSPFSVPHSCDSVYFYDVLGTNESKDEKRFFRGAIKMNECVERNI